MMQKTTTLTLDIAHAIGAVLQDTVAFSDEQKHSILTEIERRMDFDAPQADPISESPSSNDSPDSIARAAPKLQTLSCYDKFLAKNVWALGADPNVHFDTLIKTFASHAKRMGVNHPNEKTVQGMVTVAATMKSHFLHTQVDAHTRLMAIRIFKATLRSLPFIYDGPSVYPDSPEELREQYPALFSIAFADELPENTKFANLEIVMQMALTPCRSTKQNVVETASAEKGSGWSRMPRQAFPSILNAAQGLQQSISNPHMLPFGSQQPMVAQQPMLALMDRPWQWGPQTHAGQAQQAPPPGDASASPVPSRAPQALEPDPNQPGQLVATPKPDALAVLKHNMQLHASVAAATQRNSTGTTDGPTAAASMQKGNGKGMPKGGKKGQGEGQ